MPGAGLLAIRERQHALLAQRIAAVTGQHVLQIVRVALPVKIPGELVLEFIAAGAELHRFGDQPGSGQAFALHEVAIGVRDRTRGQLAQAGVIVEQIGQERLAYTDRLPLGRRQKAFGRGARSLPGQRFEDVEHLFGVFLVLQQFAEVAVCLERTRARHHPRGIEHLQIGRRHRMDDGGGGAPFERQVIAGKPETGGGGGRDGFELFHDRRMDLTDIHVNKLFAR